MMQQQTMTDNSEALLREALEPFAEVARHVPAAEPDFKIIATVPAGPHAAAFAQMRNALTAGNFRRAAEALTRPSSPAASDGDAVEPKPVAWSYEYRDDYKGVETGWHTRLSLTPVRSCASNAAYVRNVVPLYATPPSPVSDGGAALAEDMERFGIEGERDESDGSITASWPSGEWVVAHASGRLTFGTSPATFPAFSATITEIRAALQPSPASSRDAWLCRALASLRSIQLAAGAALEKLTEDAPSYEMFASLHREAVRGQLASEGVTNQDAGSEQ